LKVSNIRPPVENSTTFELYALTRLADGSGCYCLTNASGDILYAGQAVSLKQRLTQHFNSDKRQAITGFGRISRAWWRYEPSISLNALERGWLEAIRLRDGELPPLNRASGPV
jgi:hypothetical protein